jgi:hypothetical protein
MAQHIDIEVVPGPDRPVVVKSATAPTGVETLAREVGRLNRGRHPGVVEVLAAGDGRLELAWVGSHTLETTRLSVPAAAAVLAAVAVTVADLHGLGLVHGRLDPSHVILGGDGRPVLCGLRGPSPGEPEPGPAEDVAAVGRLIDHLLGPDAEPEPIPDRRWARRPWSGYHRRTLQLLADRATHDDPARRPTARALANAIVEAVPEARLVPRAPADEPEQTEEPGRTGTQMGPPDRAGDQADPKPAVLTPRTTAPTSPPPAAPPNDPGAQGPHPGADGQEEPAGPDPLRAGPFLPASTRPAPPTRDQSSPPDLSYPDPTDPAPIESPPPMAGLQPTDPVTTILGLRVEPEIPSPPSLPGERLGPGRAGPGRAHPDRADRADRAAAERLAPGPAPRSPSSVRRTGQPSSRLRTVLVAGASVAVLAVAASRLGRDSPASVAPLPADASAAPAPATGTAPDAPVDPDRSPAPGAEPDADPVHPALTTPSAPPAPSTSSASPAPSAMPPTSRDTHTRPAGGGEVITRAGARFGVGDPGDVVTVGDWDCDGTATPGVVRPTTGEVFLFDRWAEPGVPVTVTAALRLEGARQLVAPGEGCRSGLLLADGTVVAVDAGPDGWTTEVTR